MTAQEMLLILNDNDDGVVYTPEEAETILKETYKLADIIFPWLKEQLANTIDL